VSATGARTDGTRFLAVSASGNDGATYLLLVEERHPVAAKSSPVQPTAPAQWPAYRPRQRARGYNDTRAASPWP